MMFDHMLDLVASFEGIMLLGCIVFSYEATHIILIELHFLSSFDHINVQ